MELIQIGIIRSPYREGSGTPIQPVFGGDEIGEVEVFPEYAEGLDDVEGFERIWIIFGAHKANQTRLKAIPYIDTVERGIFAIRSPSRPNPICMSAVRLLERDGNVLKIAEFDILDRSPLYDIKPYIPKFDSFPNASAGWFDKIVKDRDGIPYADGRFYKKK